VVEEEEPTEQQEEAVRAKDEKKGDRKWDYYATQMAKQMATLKKDPLPVIPGTPEEVKMRHVGNQSIRSITMPWITLDLNPELEVKEGGAPARWAYETRFSRQAKASANVFVVQHELENRV
jgi:hypothetical protein